MSKPKSKDHDRKTDSADIICTDHKGQKCTEFCKDCHKAVCVTCLTKSHKTHATVQLSDGNEILLKDLSQKKRDLQQNIKIMEDREKKITEKIVTQQSQFDKAKEDIQNQKNALIKAINKYADKLLNDLEAKQKEATKLLQESQSKLSKARKQLDDKLKKLDSLSATTDTAKLLSELDQNENKGDPVKDNKTVTCRPKFNSGQFSESNFGTLKMPMMVEKDIKLKVSKNTTVSGSAILNISPSSELHDDVWIGVKSSEKLVSLERVSFQDNVIKVTSQMDKYEVTCMTVGPNKEILFSVPKSSHLMRISPNGGEAETTEIGVPPNIPSAVHVTRDDTIIIGAGKPDKAAYSLKGPGSLYKMTMDGNQIAQFKLTDTNKPLFSYPWLITSTNKGNIFVIDRFFTNEECRVVVLDNNGQLINVIKGEDKSGSKLFATGMSRTPNDEVIISDMKAHALYLLDGEGNYITSFNTKTVGIQYPYSLAFLNKGRLSIGTNVPTKGGNNTAKLYEVEYTEF